MKIFVGGYYDDRIFEGEGFEGKTPFNKDVDVYNLEEVLELGFLSGIKEYCKDEYEKDFDEMSFNEKKDIIISYVSTDEIAGLICCKNEEEALQLKQKILEEISELEKEIEYIGTEQDEDGYYKKAYRFKA